MGTKSSEKQGSCADIQIDKDDTCADSSNLVSSNKYDDIEANKGQTVRMIKN